MTTLPFGEVAPIQRRVVAYILDALIAAVIPIIGSVVMVMTTVGALTGPDPAGALVATLIVSSIVGVLTLAWLVVYTVMQAGNGSIGMRAQGIRLVRATDGAPLGFGRALLRNVIWGLAASIVVGYFTALFDGTGRFQGWHDKVADAVMLDARVPARSTTAMAPPHPRVLPDSTPAGVEPRAAGAMPGFAAPTAGTSMPGFAQGGSAPAAPGAGSPPPMPDAAVVPPMPPMPPVPPMSSTAATSVQPPDDDEFVEHTVLSPRIPRELPDDPLISFVPGVTQEPPQRVATPEPVAPEPVAQEPVVPEPVVPEPVASEPVTPVAGLGIDDDDLESTRISVPGHRLVFTWDDGQRATVSGRTVFGRNPEDESATNVAVRDETRSLSKTHFEAASTTRGGWVMDRYSTNGTVVVSEGIRIACPPGQRVPVRLGDSLEIGDRIVTIGGYV